MTGKTMYSSRYRHMVKACQYLAKNPHCGNTEIARAIGVTRQAANRIMRDAVQRGWASIEMVDWRPNVKAKRYSVAKYYPFVS